MGYLSAAANFPPGNQGPDSMKKTIWKSKTFWLQIVTLASALVPQVQSFLVENPVQFVAVLAAANTIMRFATQGKIEILGEEAP